jgi:hypothetical protein
VLLAIHHSFCFCISLFNTLYDVGTFIYKFDMEKLCERIRANDPTLKDIKLRIWLSLRDMEMLYLALKNNTSAKCLNLRWVVLTPSTVKILARILSTNKGIEVLDVGCCSLNSTDFNMLADAIASNNTTLKVLLADDNMFSDVVIDGILMLAKSKTTAIERINLSCNKFHYGLSAMCQRIRYGKYEDARWAMAHGLYCKGSPLYKTNPYVIDQITSYLKPSHPIVIEQ